MDNLFTGSEDTIYHLLGDSHFKFICHDVTELFSADAKQIYNLACPASPVYYQSDSVKTVKTNVLGAIDALELARRIGARILLQTSTSEVYGELQSELYSYHYLARTE